MFKKFFDFSIVLTCLAGGLIAIILPKLVKQYKAFARAVLPNNFIYADFEEMRRASQKVDDNYYKLLRYAILLALALAMEVVGICIICVKYF